MAQREDFEVQRGPRRHHPSKPDPKSLTALIAARAYTPVTTKFNGFNVYDVFSTHNQTPHTQPDTGGAHILRARSRARRGVLPCAHVHTTPREMTTTLSVRIDTDTKKRLEALAKRSRRSKSFLAAEAIAAFVEAESWQLDEIQKGLTELNEGRGVPHKDVAKWLRSWDQKRERKAPRA